MCNLWQGKEHPLLLHLRFELSCFWCFRFPQRYPLRHQNLAFFSKLQCCFFDFHSATVTEWCSAKSTVKYSYHVLSFPFSLHVLSTLLSYLLLFCQAIREYERMNLTLFWPNFFPSVITSLWKENEQHNNRPHTFSALSHPSWLCSASLSLSAAPLLTDEYGNLSSDTWNYLTEAEK